MSGAIIFPGRHLQFEMVGLTPIGRATIDALRLNRLGVVNLRRVLREIAELD